MPDTTRADYYDLDALSAQYGRETAEEIIGEHQAADFVRAHLDKAAELAVRWRMHIWGDGQGGYLLGYFEAALEQQLGYPLAPEIPSRAKTRPPITAARRVGIYARDNYMCVRCGCMDPKALSVDHITPVAKGGTDEDGNLQTLCRSCNSSKGPR